MFIELFARIKDYEIKDVNYDNFKDKFDIWTFSDDFGTKNNFNQCYDFRELVQEYINEDKKARPTLETLLNFFYK